MLVMSGGTIEPPVDSDLTVEGVLHAQADPYTNGSSGGSAPGGGTTPVSNPTGVNPPSGVSPSGSAHYVYYVGSDGQLRVDHWTGTAWQNDDLSVSVESGTSPRAYLG
jgi:hypothetical protein